MAKESFSQTKWSIVLIAGSDSPQGRAALASLCEIYWSPLYRYLRRKGFSAADAADCTQGFFARLIAGKENLGHLDPQVGRFRSYLIKSLDRFLINRARGANAKKRAGEALTVAFDFEEAERQYMVEPRDLAPEVLYDRRCALTFLDRALGHLRETRTPDALGSFDRLKTHLLRIPTEGEYVELATALGKRTGAVKTQVCRLRAQFRVLLRAEVAASLADPSDVDDEMRHLLSALVGEYPL